MKPDEHKALIPIQDEVLAQVLGNPSEIFGLAFNTVVVVETRV
jgi:hypothetical protein